MGFSKWLMKKGAIGSATRLLIKAYRKERKANLQISDQEIFKSITKWRCSLTGEYIKTKEFEKIISCRTLRDFVRRMVIAERWRDLKGANPSLVKMVKDIVDEICDEEGLNKNTTKIISKSNEIIKDIENYFLQQNRRLLKYLDSIEINNFTKQWINEAIVAIFTVLRDFTLSLKTREIEDFGYIELFRNLTTRSVDVYVKLNIIHLLIMCKYTKDFDRLLEWAGLKYEDFKESIFKFFNFNKELKLAYSESIFQYKNSLYIAYFNDFYRNLISWTFKKEIDSLNEEMLLNEEFSKEPLILKDLYQDSYNYLIKYITEYMKKLQE